MYSFNCSWTVQAHCLRPWATDRKVMRSSPNNTKLWPLSKKPLTLSAWPCHASPCALIPNISFYCMYTCIRDHKVYLLRPIYSIINHSFAFSKRFILVTQVT